MLNLFQRLITPLLMMGWSITYYMQFSKQKAESQLLIRPVFWIVAVLFAIVCCREIAEWKSKRTKVSSDKSGYEEVKIVATLIGGPAVYLLLLPYIGFVILTPVFLAIAFIYLKASRKKAIILAFGLTAFVYVTFKVLLNVPLPSGLLL